MGMAAPVVPSPAEAVYSLPEPPSAASPRVLENDAVWHPSGAPEPLVIDLPSFFERLLGAKNDPNAAVVRDAG